MKAIILKDFGGAEQLQISDVTKPVIKDNEVLIKAHAVALNPVDVKTRMGKGQAAKLKNEHPMILGWDVSGVIEEKGNAVSDFNIGDEVFGMINLPGAGKTYAEYVSAPHDHIALKPANVSHAEAAGASLAAMTAWQALVEQAKLKAGQKILIHAASGGVGHFAVQIAKAYGAIVTGVCSSRNLVFVKSLGADNVIAYDKENIHQHNGSYDLIVDANGNLGYSDYKRMGKRGVMIGFTTLGHMFSTVISKLFGRFPLVQFTAEANERDLQTLGMLVAQDKIRPQIEKLFSYKEIPEAISSIEVLPDPRILFLQKLSFYYRFKDIN